MKASEFNQQIAAACTTPLKTVTVYTRLLKEAGLITSGKGGRAAPDMTPLDAARVLIAILTTSSPSQCVERVRRFGPIPYAPSYKKQIRGYKVMEPEDFFGMFEGETLEDVLAFMFALPAKIGIEESAVWFHKNPFHLRVVDFFILAELFRWIKDGDEIVGELCIPFKGQFKAPEGFTPISGGVRTERSISNSVFMIVGIALATGKDMFDKGKAE